MRTAAFFTARMQLGEACTDDVLFRCLLPAEGGRAEHSIILNTEFELAQASVKSAECQIRSRLLQSVESTCDR